MDLVGYQLEMLSDRGELSLYRARHRDSESSVLVVLAEQATPSVRARLDREFIYAGALAPGLTNRPLALIDHEGGRALVLEDMGNEPLDRLLTGPLAPARFLELAIALARSPPISWWVSRAGMSG
jgi:hypothetical protein